MGAKFEVERRLHFMKSLDRTSPRLTTNIKFVVNVATGDMRFSTIESNEKQNDTQLTDRKINTNLSLQSNISKLLNSFDNTQFLYDIKSDPSDSTRKLKDQLYQQHLYGCSTPTDGHSKLKFFAPLNIRENDMPDAFVIYRAKKGSTINDLKTYEPLHVVDLRGSTATGKYFRDYISSFDNEQCMSVDFSSSTLRYNALNINTGAFEEVKENIKPLLANERTISEVDNHITNGFMRNSLMYNRIINLEFEFDDTVQGFYEYVGKYVCMDVSDDTVTDYNNYSVMLKEADSTLSVIDSATDTTQTYSKIKITSQSVISSDSSYQAMCNMRFKTLPKVFDRLNIVYKGDTEISVLFNDRILGKTKLETLNNVAEEINTQSREAVNITVSASVGEDGWMQVLSNSSSEVFETIYIEDNKAFEFESATTVFADELPVGGFNAVKPNKTLLFKNYFNASTLKYIEYTDNTGVKQIGQVAKYFNYGLFFAVDLLDKADISGNNVWLYEEVADTIYKCPLVEHHRLDSVTSDTDKYDKPFDFELTRYQTYLLDTINEPDFYGRLPIGTPTLELETYKEELRDSVNSYFDNIVYNDDIILSSINPIDGTAEYADSEYSRFDESRLLELQTGKMSSNMHKYKMYNATNAINEDDRFNVALQFGSANILPNTYVAGRDIESFSHSWFIIGEGIPPYMTNDDKKLIQGYTAERVTEEMLLDTDDDAYEALLSHTEGMYTYTTYEGDYERCKATFRGITYFVDQKFADYRFSVVMRGSERIEDDIQFKVLDNDTFKTLTLLVYFSVPDPILTSLERGDEYYFLDRSLLYFSRDILSTDSSSISFGEREMSLDIYNSVSPKTFDGNVLESTDWVHTTENDRYMYVGRGLFSRFNTNFKEIFYVGEDFEYYYGENTNIRYKLTDIASVGDDHLWCGDLEVMQYDDGGNFLESTSVFDTYDIEPDEIYRNNLTYTAQYISREMALYDKFVRAVANEIRYRTLSIAGVKRLVDFNGNDIFIESTKTIDSDYIDVFIQNATKTEIVVSKELEDKTVQRRETVFKNTMMRRSGDIELITEPCVTYNSDTTNKNMSIDKVLKNKLYEAKVGRLEYPNSKTRNAVDDGEIAIFETENTPLKTKESYVFKHNTDNKSQNDIAWKYNNIEVTGLSSIAFTYDRNFTLLMTGDGVFIDALVDHFYPVLPKYNFSTLSTQEKLDVLNIQLDITAGRINDVNFEQVLNRRFVDQYVLEKYVPKSVTDSDGVLYEFVYNTNNRKLTITDGEAQNTYTINMSTGVTKI